MGPPWGPGGPWDLQFLDGGRMVSLPSITGLQGEIMRYKSAETILVQIAGDDQASTGVRLEAIKIVANAGKLPEFKGYKSGSPENLLLRLASDSRTPAKDRLKAV